MNFKNRLSILGLLTISAALIGNTGRATEGSPIYPGKHLDELYVRMAEDVQKGNPIVMTVYVALCDNDSQGIIPTKNKKICKGDLPEHNIYWATSGGLKGHLRQQRWKQLLYTTSDTEKIAVIGVWKKSFLVGGALREQGLRGRVPVYIVGLGYRGDRIHDAMVDYLRAVANDRADQLTLKDGTMLEYGGASQLVGYVGHDYFMDAPDRSVLLEAAKGEGMRAKGLFGLACISDRYFRPAIQKRHTHILVLNNDLTYPSAYTIVGLLTGVMAGLPHKGIHKAAARAFAKGQGQTVGTMRRALSYGDKAPL